MLKKGERKTASTASRSASVTSGLANGIRRLIFVGSFSRPHRGLCLEQKFRAERSLGQDAGDFLGGVAVAVGILEALHGTPETGRERSLDSLQNFFSLGGDVENVGGMFASALANSDIQRRNS